MKAALDASQYIDVHIWRFVPSSFRLIVEDLYQLRRSSLREKQFIAGTGHEFYVSLSRDGAGPAAERIELMLDAMRELAQMHI